MFDALDPLWTFYIALIGVVLIIADTIYLLSTNATSYRRNVNRRLSTMEKVTDRQDAIVKLRRERGIGTIGERLEIGAWFSRLVVQSGVRMGRGKFVAVSVVGGVAGFIGGYLWNGATVACGGLIFCGLVLPVQVLRFLRKRRQAKFTEQLPEALDIIVRSLRAGHPVPAAIKMAAREMGDPLGSEFGMAEDEITYGLDIEAAMRNMLERVGQEDLPLFVTSVAIQASSGGNLTEILGNLTEVIRMRAKMRRKIRALSAEGRTSAIILSSVPIFIFVVINWIAPDFYGKNWGHPWMYWGLGFAAFWMGLGNLVMRNMINFRF